MVDTAGIPLLEARINAAEGIPGPIRARENSWNWPSAMTQTWLNVPDMLGA